MSHSKLILTALALISIGSMCLFANAQTPCKYKLSPPNGACVGSSTGQCENCYTVDPLIPRSCGQGVIRFTSAATFGTVLGGKHEYSMLTIPCKERVPCNAGSETQGACKSYGISKACDIHAFGKKCVNCVPGVASAYGVYVNTQLADCSTR